MNEKAESRLKELNELTDIRVREIYHIGFNEGAAYERMKYAVKADDWIRCEDRLPESNNNCEEYLTYKEGGVFQVLMYWHGWNRSVGDNGEHEIKTIIAWKPLLPPITESEEEHE